MITLNIDQIISLVILFFVTGAGAYYIGKYRGLKQ